MTEGISASLRDTQPDSADRAGHTVGPWWAASGDDVPVATYHGIVAILSSDPAIYVVTGEPGDKNGPLCSSRSWTANARLIAAAPMLLEALQRLSALTPGAANAATARDLHLTVKAIADTAILAATSPEQEGV